MNQTLLRRLVALVPLTYFRLQAAGDRLHETRGLTTGLRGLLLSLDEFGPTTASRLADMRPVSRQAIHKIAEQLIARGLVDQIENPRDKRAPLLVLTSKGRGVLQRLRASEEPQITHLFQGVEQADIEAAVRVLETLSERMAPSAWRRASAGDRVRVDKLPSQVRRTRAD